MRSETYTTTTRVDSTTMLRIVIIAILSIALFLLIALPGLGELGPAPSLTGKVMSIVPATSQEKAHDSAMLGTIVIQRNDGYQLILRLHHASGNGCLGDNTLHLSDIRVGETVTVRYWLDQPETGSNPHRGHAVYVNDRC